MKFHSLFKLLFCASALQVGAHSVWAQSTYWGYSNMEYARNSPTPINGESNLNAVAVHYNATKMKALKGAQIIGIRTAYATKNVDYFKIFVAKDLNGQPLQEKDVPVTSRPFILTDYYFDTPITIDGTAIYAGFETSTQEENRPACYFDYTHDFAQGTSWAMVNGTWTDVSQMGLGAPVMQLIINDMPATYNDVVVKNSCCDSHFLIGRPYSISSTVYNMGARPITSLKLRAQMEGAAPQEEEITGLNIQPGAEATLSAHRLLPQESGMKSWTETVTAVNGESDADMTDNAYTAQVYVYPKGMKRNLLIEKHTGQECSWCPKGDVTIDNFASARDNVIVVAHHSYLSGDLFTMKESWAYKDFFGFTTFPSASVNRFPYANSSVPLRDVAVSASGLEALADSVEKKPIQVDLQLENEFDENTRKGTLTVKVHTYDVPSDATHTLNVWLTQDNMMAGQSGANSGSAYNHSHVFRGTLNGELWGDTITLKKGSDLTKTYHYEIPSEIACTYGLYVNQAWQALPTDMHLVAFVADKTDNPLTCIVHCANTIGVCTNGNTSAIGETLAPHPTLVLVEDGSIRLSNQESQAWAYDLQGKLVARICGTERKHLPKGIYLVKVGNQTTKVVLK